MSLGPGAPSTNIPMDVYSRSAKLPGRCRPGAAVALLGAAGRSDSRLLPLLRPSRAFPEGPGEDPRLSHRTAPGSASVRSSAPSLLLY